MTSKQSDYDTNAASTNTERVFDAASLVIIKKDGNGTASVLMGQRHPDSRFLPNKYVFPGGRYETGDSCVATAGQLSQHSVNHLMLSVPATTHAREMRGLALTAIRETFEETGIAIGKAGAGGPHLPPRGWGHFLATGQIPDPTPLNFFARAITPPGRPKRYDTRFFWVSAASISARATATDGELSEIGWKTLDEAQALDVAAITRLILSDVARLVSPDESPANQSPVPCYQYQNNCFERVLLSHQDGIA